MWIFGSSPSTAIASCILGQVFGVSLDLCPVCVMGDGRVGWTDTLTTILCVFFISVLLSIALSFRSHQIRLLGHGWVTCSANYLGNLDSDFESEQTHENTLCKAGLRRKSLFPTGSAFMSQDVHHAWLMEHFGPTCLTE